MTTARVVIQVGRTSSHVGNVTGDTYPEILAAAGGPPRDRLGVVSLGTYDIGRLLHLPDGIRIRAVVADPLAQRVRFVIEGDTLPEVPHECEPPHIPLLMKLNELGDGTRVYTWHLTPLDAPEGLYP